MRPGAAERGHGQEAEGRAGPGMHKEVVQKKDVEGKGEQVHGDQAK